MNEIPWRSVLVDAVRKLDPRQMVRNPVMFVVEIAAVLATVLIVAGDGEQPVWFTATVAVWLWLTVLFANVAESVADGAGGAGAAGGGGDRA